MSAELTVVRRASRGRNLPYLIGFAIIFNRYFIGFYQQE